MCCGEFHSDLQTLDLLLQLRALGMFSNFLSLENVSKAGNQTFNRDSQLKAEKPVVHLYEDLARPQ